MERPRRQGCCRSLDLPRKAAKSPAQRAYEYRQSVLQDPERAQDYRQKHQERNLRNYHLPVTDEEKQRRREMAKLRQQRHRDRKKAERRALGTSEEPKERRPTRTKERETKETVKAQREKWKKQQQQYRATWGPQKKRRHKERAREYYYRRKAASQCTESPCSTPPPAGDSKAVYRATKAIMSIKSQLFVNVIRSIGKHAQKSPRKRRAMEELKSGSPAAKVIKDRCLQKLQSLKTARSKEALAAKKVLFDTVNATESPAPGTYKKKLSKQAADVREFLEEVAVDMPIRSRQQKKMLPKRVKWLHRDLNKRGDKVSLATFYRNIPKNLLKCSKRKFCQGLCKTCAGIDLKLDIMNKFLSKEIDGRDCLSEASLCATPTLACYQRCCDVCGVHQVEELIRSNVTVRMDTGVVWFQWEMVANEVGKGKACENDLEGGGKKGEKRRKDVVTKTGTLLQLINLLLKELESFSHHLFVGRWQRLQLHAAKSSITHRPQLAIAICDYAENYQCKHQNEVQSAHWGYVQITVHPTVLYYKCHHCPALVTEYLVFSTDDLNKDAAMTKVIMDLTITHLGKAVGAGLRQVIFYSDGCAAQYKSKLPLFHLANTSGPVQVTRAYFGSRHGKSPSDSCGGVVKNLVDDDVRATGVHIQSAGEFISHCSKHHVLPEENQEGCCHIKRSFIYIDPKYIDRSFVSNFLQSVPGTRSVHSVRGVASTTEGCCIQTRKLACFCTACLDRKEESCSNMDFVDKWQTVKLKLTKTAPGWPAQSHQQPWQEIPSQPVSSQCQPEPAPPQPTSRKAPHETQLPSPHDKESMSRLETEMEPDPPQETPQEIRQQPPQETPQEIRQQCNTRQRQTLFQNLYQDMNRCQTFLQLQELVLALEELPDLPHPENHTFVSIKGAVDQASLSLQPSTVPKELFPVLTMGDGNCLPRSLSTIVYGKEVHHIEMRCRVVIEMVRNFHSYIQGYGMGPDTDFVTRYMAVLSDNSALTFDAVTQQDVIAALESEIMVVRKKAQNMGLWQIAAAANVLGRPVTSYFPEKGWEIYQELNNRTLLPRSVTDAPGCAILWTSNRTDMDEQHWTSNHFVPLLPLIHAQSETVIVDSMHFTMYDAVPLSDVQVSDFYWATWKGLDVVGRVDQVYGDGTLLLNFMVEEKGLYVWPSVADTSVESASVLKSGLSLELVPEKSTQRKQIFKVVD